ncbi:UNVERIFIED_CONTAM: hypothetical protein Slati_3036700, partial [Sesamum latifolium]
MQDLSHTTFVKVGKSVIPNTPAPAVQDFGLASSSAYLITVDCALSCFPAAEFKKMNSLSATGFFPKYPVFHHTKRRRYCSRVPAVFSTLKASPPP